MSRVPKTYNGKPLIHVYIYDNQECELGVVAWYQDGEDKKDIVPDGNGGFNAGIYLDCIN